MPGDAYDYLVAGLRKLLDQRVAMVVPASDNLGLVADLRPRCPQRCNGLGWIIRLPIARGEDEPLRLAQAEPLGVPGRMRFEYDAPSALKIVADGTQVTMWDVKTNDFGQWPIGWTAASFLVKDQLRLAGEDLQVENVERANGMISVTMTQSKKPTEGKVTVRVSDGGPMQLRGWTIIDSRGNRVDVALSNVQSGAQLADSLFKFDGPDPSQMRRN